MANEPEDSGPLIVGAFVKYVRETLYVDEFNTMIFSQEALGCRCREIDVEISPDHRPRSFKTKSEASAKKRIGGIENQGRADGISKRARRVRLIICRAFKLSEEFLERPYPDFEAVKSAYLAARAENAAKSATQDSQSPPGQTIEGLSPVDPTEFIAGSRVELAKALTQKILSHKVPNGRCCLVLIEGGYGIGKSFFLRHWLSAADKSLFDRAFRIDCTDQAPDTVIAQLEKMLAPPAAHSSAATLEALLPDRSLVALDGLSVGDLAAVGATTSDFLEPSRRLLRAMARTGNGILVLMLENSSSRPRTDSLRRLFPEAEALKVKILHEVLPPLADHEGALMLKALGLESLPEQQLERLSRHLSGLPIVLAIAAVDYPARSAEEQESYVEDVPAFAGEAGSLDTQTAEFMQGMLTRVRRAAQHQEADPHPLALLRLLALMPGPISEAQLGDLLSGGEINRLTRLSARSALLMPYPFIEVVDDKIDVNAKIRRLLRDELRGIAKGLIKDRFTTASELEWIHWKSAVSHLYTISKIDAPDGDLVAAVEAFVYHVVEQIRIRPTPRNGRGIRRVVDIDAPGVLRDLRRECGALSNNQLWRLAHSVVRKHLLLNQKVTRVLGLFETKARILEWLVMVVRKPGAKRTRRRGQWATHVAISNLDWVELHKEIAVCRRNAGQLLSADAAIEQATRAISAAGTVRARHKSRTECRTWELYCETLAARASIGIRLGQRHVESLLEDLRPGFEEAREAANRILRSSGLTTGARDMARSAIKLLGRFAELVLLSGEVPGALALFDLAASLQRKIGLSGLDGEIGRRYVRALVRGKTPRGSNLSAAAQLVEANLKVAERNQRGVDRPSSDVIPLLVLRAGLHRIAGRHSKAADTLARARSHEQFSRTTFMVSAELEMEELRWAISESADRSDIEQRATALHLRLKASHHEALADEALLLVAEVCEVQRRAEIIEDIGQRIQKTGVWLRRQDLAVLMAGKSAVRRFGF